MRISILKCLLIKQNAGIEIGNETFRAASDGDTKLVFTSEMLEEATTTCSSSLDPRLC
jgi:hypothetical protein